MQDPTPTLLPARNRPTGLAGRGEEAGQNSKWIEKGATQGWGGH